MLRTKKRFFLLFVIVGLVATLASCASSKKYVKITLDSDCYEVYKGQTIDVVPLVNKGSSVGEVVIEYSSYDDSIATYTDGKLKGVEYGETIIKVIYANNVTICDVATVKVVEYNIESNANVDETPIELYEENSAVIPFDVYAETVYSFVSSNPEVATVDENGKVTAQLDGAQHNEGKATITVTATDIYGILEGITFEVEVTVLEADHAITFDCAGGAIEGTYATEYSINHLPHVLPTPVRDGYTFKGWLLNGAETPVLEIPAGSKEAVAAVADWEANTYTITYEDNAATTNENETSYKSGVGYTFVAPTKVGYTFVGWYTDAACSEGKEITAITTEQFGDITVYAKWDIITYTVTFDAAGGNAVDTIEYDINDETFALPATEKEGYNFKGWFDGETEVTTVVSGSHANISVVAKWEAKVYNITYVLNGATTNDNPATYTYAEGVTLKDPVKLGFSFIGWFTDAAFTAEKEIEVISKTHTGDITLYAKFEIITYTITFDEAGGTAVEDKTYTVESDTIVLAAIEREGYTFGGWFKGETVMTEVVSGSTGNIELVAKWTANSYAITYVLPTGATHANPASYKYDDGLVLEDAAKDGYTFNGWFTDAAFTAEKQVTEIDSKSHEAVTLYAKLTINTYTVTYNANGGVAVEADEFTIETPTFALATTTKVGHAFAGWFVGETKVTEVALGSKESITVVAKWTPLTYAITYNTNGATTNENPATYTYGVGLTLADPVKVGYSFAGWYEDEACKDKAITTIAADRVNPVTVYAKWNIVTYKVTFDEAGGVAVEDKEFNINSETFTLPTTTRTGYTFLGWFVGTTKVTVVTSGTTENITVVAKWDADDYDITYNLNGGTNNAANVAIYEFGTGLTLSDPTKTGYTFKGWYEDAACATTPITVIAADRAEDVTVYAKWAINQYTITFDTDGGSAVAAITSDYADAITAPANPTKTGYTFAGWDKVIPATMPAENMTIKATWTINQYTITFDTDGGSAVAAITLDYNAAITAPANPTKTGYTFVAWDKVIPATMPAEDMTIKATWTINQYTITFDTDGGSAVAAITLDYNAAITAPANPTKTGYTFVAWDKVIPTNMPAEDMTIKATWSINQYTISFDTVGGSAVADITLDFGAAITAPTAPTKDYYDFAGWATTIPANMPAEDLEIKATWTPTVYDITFVNVPATGTNANPVTYTIETETITLVDLVAAHYEFLGWFADEALTEEIEEIVKGSHGDITIYCSVVAAKYDIVYNLPTGAYFETPGNTTPVVSQYEHAQEVVLETPTLPGYKFVGWYDNETLSGTAIAKIETGSSGTKNFYPKWEVREYSITFVVAPVADLPETEDGQMYEIEGLVAPTALTFTIESPEMTFAPLTAAGYEFAGWYFVNEGQLIKLKGNFLPSNQHGNITFYALWNVAE